MEEPEYIKEVSQGRVVAFLSQRTQPDIQVPRHVFDLWLPVLGADAVGVYSTYCRLEHSNLVHGMTMEWLAHQLRIGVPRLRNINKMLEDCGFIMVCKPIGEERLAHLCTTIVVKDAPPEISADIISKYGPEHWEYQPLVPQEVQEEEVEPKAIPKQKPTVEVRYGASYLVEQAIKQEENEIDAPDRRNGRSFSQRDNHSFSDNSDPLPIPRESNNNYVSNRERPNGFSGRKERDYSAVAFSTPGAAYMVELLTKEGVPLHRSPAKKFPSVTAKERFEAAEERLGLESFKKVLTTFITKQGFPAINAIVGYVSKAADNNAPPAPPIESLDQALYAKVVEALRLNPQADTSHAYRAAAFTKTCMDAGYTAERVRKAGRQWWANWPGKTGTPPKDGQFIQTIETVIAEGL